MRGPSVLLADVNLPDARLLQTTDPYEARVRTQELLQCPHRMTVLERGTPFLARVQHRTAGGLGLMSSSYGPAVEIGCSPPIDKVTVSFVHGGRLLIDDGGRTAVADARHAAVFCYHEDLNLRWTPGLRQLMLTVRRSHLERFLQNLLHQPLHRPLRFQTRVDLGNGGQALAAAVLTLRGALERCGKAGPSPVLASEIEHTVLTTLLLCLRHNYTDAVYAAPTLPAPRVVRRVVELIDSTPQTAFTVADLAGHAGVSERSLHAAFRRQLGVSPISYLRGRRLEQAHDELLHNDSGTGLTVTDVALRYGFAHPGRFAAAYRQRFGEPPSATLRR
ncbi:MAG TPA: AraC family transcriptional regulator [Actinophytocola sp.]|uniref:helix-turn-helix transcriptional regulator n=1 Tax=Actinophytocola sp. TaxID=1872138 RepID=UPI002DBB10E7|nr:AraC family transcriptional regulator [Actinophytocola sp.]HEU5470240.1 AraC family transcriptional regulator [Actinophytocola sp.]